MEAIPYFEDVSEKRELLLKTDALKKRQPEVAEYFMAHSAPGERVLFVKSLFNNTFTETILDSGQRVGYRAYDDVLHLWRGSYLSREQEEHLSWEDLVSAIEGMIQDGLWAEPVETVEQLTLEMPVSEEPVQDNDYIPNLFELAGSTIPVVREPTKSTAPIRPMVAQNVIDAALALGANDPDSRLHIIAEFMKDKPLKENARFLQEHYQENGAGFYVGERKYALWYDESGLRIAHGESAQSFTAAVITWEQAAERIRELLDEGRYAGQAMLYRAWPFEENRVAEALQYLHRDLDEDFKDKYLPTLTAYLGGTHIYPDVVDKTKELLEQPEQLQKVIAEFIDFAKDYSHNRRILRSHHHHRPDEILQGLQGLKRTPLTFTALPDFAPVERFFISQDEIDNLLREHPDRHDYRIGVYNFFQEHSDRKEREKYLSHLHGEYSGYHGGNDNITYTYKELTFTHGDITEPYAAIKLKWPQVRKRMEELIKKDAFLSPEDREIMESRTLETPAEETSPLETAKALIRKLWQSDHISPGFSDPSRVLLTNAITENEKHGIQVFADLNNYRLLFEVNGHEVSALQCHDLDDLCEYIENKTAADMICFAKEQYVIRNFDGLAAPDNDSAEEIASTPNLESAEIIDSTFNYRRLSQMKADCEYFLGAGNRKNKHLWEESIFSHIKEMRRIYDLLPEKPEWLTMEEIDSYAQRMAPRYQVVVYHHIHNGFDEMPEYQTLQEAEQIARDCVSGKRVDYVYENMEEDGFHYEGAAVLDVQERQWLFVEGYFPVLEGDKELPYLPYKIEDAPEQSQPVQEQSPAVRELYEKYKAMVIDALENDQPYRNACQNSDKDTAYLEGGAAIKRVVLAAGDDTLTKLFFDNPKFHNDIHREALGETYPLFSQPEQVMRPDYVFDNVGNSSAVEPDTLPISDEVQERAEQALAERNNPQTIVDAAKKEITGKELEIQAAQRMNPESESIIDAQPQMVPNIEEYTRIKAQYPNHVVGVQNGDVIYFYGADAEKAGPALNRNVLIRNIPGMGAVPITGDAESWQASREKLLRKGIDLIFVRLDDTAKYAVIISGTAAEYIPTGMELNVDGRRCRIEGVDFEKDAVRLTVLDSGSLLTESVRYVRGFVEDAYSQELDRAAAEAESRFFVEQVLEDVERLAEQEPSPTVCELYEKYKAMVIDALENDQPYRNACQNSDKDTAYLEGGAAIKRAVLAAGDDTLTKLYFDNPKFHNDLHREALEETYPLFSQPEQVMRPEDNLTDLQIKAIEIAKQYQGLPLQEKLNIIAQTFGCATGKIETSPCTGKWRGTSDISIRFDKGMSIFIGNELTPKAKTLRVQNERVNNTLVRYNPEIVGITKETALPALRQREAKDNAIAAEKGLKPYTLINVELHDGTKDGGYIGWYYVTLAVDGKIFAHLESGLNHDISHGKVSGEITREKYFTAGALKETEVDYVFNNVGHSSTAELYTLHISDEVRERAEQALAERNIPQSIVDTATKEITGKGLGILNNLDFQRYMEKEMAEDLQPELVQQPRDPLAPAYQVGDTVYLNDTEFTITEVGLFDVQLQDPALSYPVLRSESKANFEKLLRRDERNLPITDYFPITEIGPADNGDDLRDVLTSEGGLLDEQAKNEVAGWLQEGMGNEEIARRLEEKYDRTYETMALETGEQVDYSVHGDRIMLDIMGKSRTVMMYDLRTVVGALRAMYQQEMGGQKNVMEPPHKPGNPRYTVVSDEFGDEAQPFTIWDSWNRLHYVETGDLAVKFSTRGEAQTYADKINGAMYAAKPVAIYPAEKNNLPFDVVTEKVHVGEPQRRPVPKNFHITDDDLGAGGAKTKYQMNMAAIKALHDIEQENRPATLDEQETLSKYVGWGALADAFDESKPSWASEYKELRETFTPEEYESARASTLNAHYTSPTVIKAMYQALENMGFHGGNILEPSCGVGNFFGLLPESMAKSKLYGVELDGLTGRIAKQLYPNAHIEIKGYENTSFQNNSFDLAIGNVPFGNYQVFDPAYNKLGFSIHNYFFAKTIEQVRPGGIIAFVTSRYTMDSKSTRAREYMAQRAELLGAVRLPSNAFLANAGTEVVTDILFLQKRERPIVDLPDWVYTEKNADGYAINSYFIDHPEMVLGAETSQSTRYGNDYTVTANPGADLGELLAEAITHIDGQYMEAETFQMDEEKKQETLPADPDVKNFAYTIVKGDVYYRQDSVMVKMDLGATAKARTMALIDLRDCTRRLINEQLDSCTPEESIRHTQEELNRLYDNFTAKFGRINDKINERAFSQDSSYYLLCALEILDDEGKFVRKSDMFTKRTIYPHQEITHVDTATEALAVSLGERAKVDIPFMAGLTGKTEDEIISDLQGQIYRVPLKEPPVYQTDDEYLSGNVREKLKIAEAAASADPAYQVNVSALEAVQPRDLDASEISVRLGTDWIDQEYIEQFMYETLRTPGYARNEVHVMYSSKVHAWNISNKTHVRKDDVTAYSTYGTPRVSAYKLLEDALNLQNAKVYDTIEDAAGNEKRVFNAKETTLAQQKQSMLKLAFQDWIWRDPDRREKLVRKYNDEMNCIRPREYDGSHLVLAGMNPEIQLEKHQKSAIARAIYGGNTLFAHCVGAGKTFEITASAMEIKRLGLCSKSMIVVPNHITGQWASEFLRLYPNANILVTTKRDFEKDRRKKFCSRIATGDYDAVIIGYSQFEKIPISKERQLALLQQQIDSIVDGIAMAKAENGQHFTVKNLERTKRSLEDRLKKLQADHCKDNVINFEELGIDRLFVDESDNFKNLFMATKMQNVAGLSTSDAQKSSDMFNKTRYLDEITDYKGVIFATGTPISNSITEMFTVQRYLQYNALEAMHMEHFDSWASRFGETVTTMELAPEGTGYRPRERFAKFFNLPELMSIFHEVADIKTEDMLNLPTPDVEFHNIVAKPTEFQKSYVQELSERATAVRRGNVKPTEDNMLKITNDGRKLGLDQRLISPLAEDDPTSKLNLCVENIMKYWEDGKAERLTQLVFSDLSTPKKDGGFNVYDDIKRKLIERGVPENEVAFIHDAESEVKKKELFAKVRSGRVRVLIGSTQKLGAGTNIQDRLIALHHLDVPWRPRDLTQREGRIKRRGNQNPLVHVYRYVTESTFDSYLFQTVEKKQQFIGQIMTSKSPARTCDDVDEAALSYAEVKALCAGDPRIKERMELDVDVARLQVMQASHRSQQYNLEDKLRKYFPQEQQRLEWRIEGIRRDMATLSEHPLPSEGYIGIELLGQHFTERKAAGVVLLKQCKDVTGYTTMPVGRYRGLEVLIKKQNLLSEPQIILKGAVEYALDASDSDIGNITRIDNVPERLPEELSKAQASLENVKQQIESAGQEVGRPFPQEQELKDKLARIAELDIALKMGDEGPEKASARSVPSLSAEEITR